MYTPNDYEYKERRVPNQQQKADNKKHALMPKYRPGGRRIVRQKISLITSIQKKDIEDYFKNDVLMEKKEEPAYASYRYVTPEKEKAAAKPAGKIEQLQNEEETQKKLRKKHRVSGVIFYSVAALTVLLALLFGSQGVMGNYLGYSIFSVLTESMQSEIPKGSLVIVKKTAPEEIQLGDDITFLQKDDTTVTHRVIEIFENYEERGIRAFRTWGIENALPDKEIVYEGNVVGVVVNKVAGVGGFFMFIKENVFIIAGAAIVLCVLFVCIRSFVETNKKIKAIEAGASSPPQ